VKLPKILFYRSDSNTDIEDDVSLDNNKKKNCGRRRQDIEVSSNADQLLNLDRRAANSDRRISDDHNYRGPSRRYTIDRRLNLKDRRAES